MILDRSFYKKNTVEVAKKLLGARIVRVVNGQIASGIIVETEAYCGSNDAASHAYKKTKRSEILFGQVGRAYVYFTYGMHFCFNVVAKDTQAGGVLIRALEPIDGIASMKNVRKKEGVLLTNGPAKLTQALQITKKQTGIDLTKKGELYIIKDRSIGESQIVSTPRIGISAAKDNVWRFYIKDNKWVSQK